MKFLVAETEEELEVVTEKSPQVQKTVVKIQKLSADERARDLSERREKARRDIASRERWARAEGKAEGRAEGKAEGRAEGKAEGRAQAIAEEREIWENVVADKDAEIARLKEQLSIQIQAAFEK